jgi:hypothetical protein
MTDTTPINIDQQPIPTGHFLVLGAKLQNTAKSASIPFRVARKRSHCGHQSCWVPVGIIIANESLAAWEIAASKAEARRQYQPKSKQKS